ncbi:hypothetical protein KM043_004164 [Ampulex compressa]|nr:hypothetical protein KM043_004164 [Ampulex compressa]
MSQKRSQLYESPGALLRLVYEHESLGADSGPALGLLELVSCQYASPAASPRFDMQIGSDATPERASLKGENEAALPGATSSASPRLKRNARSEESFARSIWEISSEKLKRDDAEPRLHTRETPMAVSPRPSHRGRMTEVPADR